MTNIINIIKIIEQSKSKHISEYNFNLIQIQKHISYSLVLETINNLHDTVRL